MDDPKLLPFASMYQIDRDQYGIGPLPKQAKVRIFRGGSKDGYDAMLQIYDESTRTSHHVAFRQEGDSYHWIGEGEECYGPRTYKTVDGTFSESLVVDFFHGVRATAEGLNIYYTGPDTELTNRHLTVSEANIIHAKWHCD